VTTSGAFLKPSIGSRLTSGLMIAAALALTAACSRGGAITTSMETTPSVADLSSATYREVFEESVTLIDGRWEGAPFVDGGASRPSVGLVDHFVLTGDLDGDERDDAAVVLWQSSGGSGTRLYLAAMSKMDGRVTNLGTALIGDRVQIRSGMIDSRRIVLDLVRAGPKDAACCPTEKALVAWVLRDGGLSVLSEDVIGTLSTSDLEGPEWMLVELGWEQPVPDRSEITLRFVKDRAEGHTGCNSYFAGVTAGAPGEFGFNGMGTTRAACPEPAMELERSYLAALADASTFSFLGGRLVIGCDTEKGRVALVFAPRDSATGVGSRVDVE
jgi:heat shock protein HslJ